MMKLSRRRLLGTALGMGQLALLERSGLLSSSPARAAVDSALPSRLLTIWIDGGCHWETMFTALTAAGISKYIPAPAGGLIPFGYTAAQVSNFDRTSFDPNEVGPVRKLRGPVYWNWDDPKARTGVVPGSDGQQQFRPYGYAWADPAYKLYDKTCVLVGADQGTASHQSGRIASMSGVAGATFRSPAVQAVVANAMRARFPDRPLLNVHLGGTAPTALGLPSAASPTTMTSLSSVEPTLSDRREAAWQGLRARTATDNLGFDGSAGEGSIARTLVDDTLAKSMRAMRGRSNAGSDALLEQLYDSYKDHSALITRDVMTSLSKTNGFEHLTGGLYDETTACIGSADACGPFNGTAPWDFALQLLKSDLVTSVNLRATSIGNASFDTHAQNGPQVHTNHLHIAFESIGRMLLEMDLTPAGNGKTLLDDTLVYIYSDFGRTFPLFGSDHHPATCAVLVGGGVRGNQMIGGYDESINGTPLGSAVDLISEDGARETRMPKSQDVAATVMRAFGLVPGRDFFLPGGYGVFDGALNVG